VGAEIFTNFWCFVHNFGYRYARKSFKGSKDADFGLVSEKILSHNNGSETPETNSAQESWVSPSPVAFSFVNFTYLEKC